jgi:hypothetical protein
MTMIMSENASRSDTSHTLPAQSLLSSHRPACLDSWELRCRLKWTAPVGTADRDRLTVAASHRQATMGGAYDVCDEDKNPSSRGHSRTLRSRESQHQHVVCGWTACCLVTEQRCNMGVWQVARVPHQATTLASQARTPVWSSAFYQRPRSSVANKSTCKKDASHFDTRLSGSSTVLF